MSPDAPNESNSHLLPTKPSSGSAHNSQFPPPQISPPPNPAPPPPAHSPPQPSHPAGTAVSPRRSIHTRANVPPPIPPPHEIRATLAAGEIARSPPNSSSPSPRSTHSPAPQHLSPAKAAASARPQLRQAQKVKRQASKPYACESPHWCRAHSNEVTSCCILKSELVLSNCKTMYTHRRLA